MSRIKITDTNIVHIDFDSKELRQKLRTLKSKVIKAEKALIEAEKAAKDVSNTQVKMTVKNKV